MPITKRMGRSNRVTVGGRTLTIVEGYDPGTFVILADGSNTLLIPVPGGAGWGMMTVQMVYVEEDSRQPESIPPDAPPFGKHTGEPFP